MLGNSAFKIIHNPIDIRCFVYNETLGNTVRVKLGEQDKIVIDYVSRFSYQKNHELFLQMFQQIIETEDRAILVFVG